MGTVLDGVSLHSPSLGQFILCLIPDINKPCDVLVHPGKSILLDFTQENSLVLVLNHAVSQGRHQVTLPLCQRLGLISV